MNLEHILCDSARRYWHNLWLCRLQCLRAQLPKPVVELLLRDPPLPAKRPVCQTAGSTLLDHTEPVLCPIRISYCQYLSHASPSWCEVSKNSLSVFRVLGYCLTFSRETKGGGWLSAYDISSRKTNGSARMSGKHLSAAITALFFGDCNACTNKRSIAEIVRICPDDPVDVRVDQLCRQQI